MEPIEIDSVVKSITFLRAKGDGSYDSRQLTDVGPRKKQSKALKPLERFVRKLVQSELAAAKTYIERHEQSNQKKPNGWVKDFGKNLKKAANAAEKRAKGPKLTIVR